MSIGRAPLSSVAPEHQEARLYEGPPALRLSGREVTYRLSGAVLRQVESSVEQAGAQAALRQTPR